MFSGFHPPFITHSVRSGLSSYHWASSSLCGGHYLKNYFCVTPSLRYGLEFPSTTLTLSPHSQIVNPASPISAPPLACEYFHIKQVLQNALFALPMRWALSKKQLLRNAHTSLWTRISLVSARSFSSHTQWASSSLCGGHCLKNYFYVTPALRYGLEFPSTALGHSRLILSGLRAPFITHCVRSLLPPPFFPPKQVGKSSASYATIII